MRLAQRETSLFLLLAASLFSSAAAASSNYPAEIQKQLSLSYTPACSICHQGGVTGYGTVTTPFGQAMRARGLVCCDIASLDAALAALEAEASPYITYLEQGLDPNNPGAGAVPPATYGCLAVTGREGRAGPAFALLVLLALRAGRRRSGV
jgi:hypothetical protein